MTLAQKFSSAEPETRRLAVRELAKTTTPESAELLVRALGDADWRVRKEAALVAKNLEPRAAVLDALYGAIDRKDDVGLRNAAVEALRTFGKDAVAVAERAFSNLDADGRKLAIEVLTATNDESAFAVLARALKDEDANVRVAAAECLATFSQPLMKTQAIALLSRELEKDSPVDFALACLRSLDALGAVLAVEAIEPHLEDSAQKPAALRLLARARAARATLISVSLLSDPSRTVTREAARALFFRISEGSDEEREIVSRTLGPAALEVEKLRAIVKKDSDAVVRAGAMLALSLLRDPDDASIFIDALADDSVAEAAELSLRLYGQNESSALLTATMSAAPSARGAAISMMPLVAREGDALAMLRAALSDKEPDVVIAALRSLSQVGAGEDVARIAKFADHENAAVSIAAAHALAALTEAAPEDARALWADLREEDASAAGCVIAACLPNDAKNSDVSARVAYLVRGASHADSRVRSAAIEGLGSFPGAEGAKQAVTFAVLDEEPGVALSAVRSLAALADEDALTHVMMKSKDASLLGAAFEALRKFSEGHAEIAMRLLKERLPRETDENMRAAITFTLRRAEGEND